MTEKTFTECMAENIFKDEMLPIFEFFEPYCSRNKKEDVLSLELFKHELGSNGKVEQSLSQLQKHLYAEQRKIIMSYMKSLRAHIQYFRKLDIKEDINKAILKKKKILIAYMTLSRLILSDVQIQQKYDENSDIKTILCVGLIDIEKDDIKVNDEIIKIQNISMNTRNFLVIPIQGCSFNLLEKQLKRNKFDYVHIAGHCDGNKLYFSDEGVTNYKFFKHINNLKSYYQLWFFNCCKSYDYVYNYTQDFKSKIIGYDGILDSFKALEVGTLFYEALFMNKGYISQAWENVENSCDTQGYLLSN